MLAHSALPGRVTVACVDHGLRPEAPAECAFVATICAGLAVPCATLPIKLGEGNTLEQARKARYAALRDWALNRDVDTIATGHQLDDQVETFFMRLARGSGLHGLAGIRASTLVAGPDIRILRPLLGFRRAELEQVVAEAGIDPVRDPSNENVAFDRIRIRRKLAEFDLVSHEAIAATVANLADAEDAVAWASRKNQEENLSGDRTEMRYRSGAPKLIAGLAVMHAVSQVGRTTTLGPAMEVVDRLMRGEQVNLAGVLASIEGEEWVFRPEPPRRGG
ncbi:MAG: tRNA lysidine(34) synthetase TilS [Erythrobacter sp.]|nr:tRNA lysidine(34) synthetase TilS [Erythrobacter sp.]